ncbi:MAG: zinc ABC transporter substrate-binding protein [Candidatus Margulisiibacteriota bacterium]|nr:zinc ABC transporter substrate-binding protein [Candidatus Margulisiibacteriota bacterium]
MIQKITILLVSIFLMSCNTAKNNKPVVISTTGMIHNIVKEIGNNHVNAIGLMGPGIDPHLYKASAGDVKKLNEADLILYNGLHLEAKMIDIFKKLNKRKPAIAVTSSIPKDDLLAPEDYDGFYDPHVWFDISLWKYAVITVTNALIEIKPQLEKEFLTNQSNYLKKLDELDIWVKEQINLIPQNKRLLVTAHDAFGYFGKQYGIKVVGLQGISTAAEANTKDIQNVVNVIIENNIPTIFIESSVPVRQINAVKAAVKAKGNSVEIGQPLFTDAMGSANTPEGTYIGMIKHNVSSIVNGLK